MSKGYNQLFKTVIDKSNKKTWEEAVQEWQIVDSDEDESCESSCVCGKENIRYLFKIENLLNGNTIFPIGSSCIKKFQRHDLNEKTSVEIQFYKLLKAVNNGEYIELKGGLLNRRLLKLLYEKKAFDNPQFNSFNTYEFILNMFNKRDPLTEYEQKRVNAIIYYQIIPFARNYKKLQSNVNVN